MNVNKNGRFLYSFNWTVQPFCPIKEEWAKSLVFAHPYFFLKSAFVTN